MTDELHRRAIESLPANTTAALLAAKVRAEGQIQKAGRLIEGFQSLLDAINAELERRGMKC